MSRIVLVTAALLVAVFWVAAAPALAAPPYVVETPVAATAGTQDAPAICEGYWEGMSYCAWEGDGAGDWNVFAHLPVAPGTTVVPVGAGDQRHPAVSDDWIVYEDDSGGNWDIRACAVSHLVHRPSPSPSPFDTPVTSGTADQLDPAIDRQKVVYEDMARGNSDISFFNLAGGTHRRLTSSRAAQVDPAIDGNWVVYADHRNGNWDIYSYNLSTRKERRLTSNGSAQQAPQIAGTSVVYQDHRNGNWDIYLCSLRTGKERRLTTNRANQTEPQIDASSHRHRSVVYQDDRNGAADIYLVHLATGIEKRVTNDPAAQESPAIALDTVVWGDARGTDPDVYRGHLVFPDLGVYSSGGTPAYNGTATFDGWLDMPDPDYSPIGGARVVKLGTGGTRTLTTADDGAFGIALPHVKRKATIRVVYRGDASHLPATAGPESVKPKALLTRPTLRKPTVRLFGSIFMPAMGDHYIVSGYLKPRHRAGSRAVTLRCYKRRSWPDFDWVVKKTVKAKVSNYGTYSMYKARVSLPLATFDTKWKVRATHGDRDHAWTESALSRTIGR